MTKRLLFLCFLASSAGAQTPTVNFVTYDSLSHSTLRIDFSTSANWIQGHIRYIDTTANPGGVCTDGTSGIVQPNGYNNFASNRYGYYEMVVGGLTPGHTYSFCPEVNGTFNGPYSTGGAFVSVTLPNVPAIHPAAPIPPTTFPTGYPSDMASYPTLRMGTDCANFVACMTTAINNQRTNGTIISVPAGVSASSVGGVGPFGGEGVFPVAPDVVNFSPSAVNTSANTVTSAAHGLSEGSQAVFGVSYGCLPGDYTANTSNCKGAGNFRPIPFPRGVPLFIHVVDANTFQVYTCPGATNGTEPSCSFSQGTLIKFADAGSGTMRYARWPRALHYIIVRTSTPDSQFVPLGSMLQGPPDGTGVPTRPTQWLAKMGNLQVAPGANGALITFGDLNTDPMTANIRIVGLHFSYTDISEPAVSGDPTNGGAFFSTDLVTQNISWDRCYFDAPGSPFRTGIVFSWNGVNNGFFGNYVTGMEGWTQTQSGLTVAGSGTTATITSGSNHFGAGTGTLASNASIALSGTMGGQNRLFLDFSMGGTLNIVAPPGITPTVSGISSYHIVSVAAAGPGMEQNSSSGLNFPGNHQPTNYLVDPVVSSDSSCSSTTSLMAPINGALSSTFTGGAYTVGTQFTNDVGQYLCGIRFYKLAAETGSSHIFGFWDALGNQIQSVTTSGESASGWQTATLSKPYLMSAGTQYVVGVEMNTALAQVVNAFRNSDYYNANMHVSGAFVASNGNGSYADMWPLDYRGNVAVGILGFVDISPSGTIVGAGNAGIGTTYSGNGNTMIGGLGPGPWVMIGNFISGAGLPWHFDNSGLRWAMRGDYTLFRNYHYMPRYAMFGTPYSNGLDYTHRQSLEWKGGQRIQVYGSIFDGSIFEGGSKNMIALQSPGEDPCITDADVMYNTFKHGPGTLGGGLEYYPGTGGTMACPPVRTRYAQNISWDMTDQYSVYVGYYPGTGWLLNGQLGAEDVIVDHNTDIGRSGGHPTFWDQPEFRIEGVQITNNFLQIEPQYGGVYADYSSMQTTHPCNGLIAKRLADCTWSPSYTMSKNALLSLNGSTQQQIQAFWPTLPNYIPANGAVTAQGFHTAQGSYSLTTPDPDLRLLHSSAFCSGCGSPGTDLRDVGANVDQVWAKQGKVTLSSVDVTGTGSASVTVVQPDTGTCTLDYGTEPTVTTFSRISQACTPGPVNFNVTGLLTGTLYYFRYNGAVQQPMGQFKTH